jgi:hypothetical protein
MTAQRLFLLQPAIVFQARVNQAAFTYPLTQVTFDGVIQGAAADVKAGMTVFFGTAQAADDLGRARTRAAASAAALYFARIPRGTHDGELDLADDAYITVFDDYRVWSKNPYIDEGGNIYKDGELAYVDQTSEPPPVANAGGHVAGTIDDGTGLLIVQLPGPANTSFATADGATIASYAWTLPAGVTLLAGYALTDAVIIVECLPGFYWVTLTVTDSNGKDDAARVAIFARDPDDDATVPAFEIVSHTIRKEGQQLSVRVLADIPDYQYGVSDTYPDGTLVMLWEDEPADPVGDHMIFTGWVMNEPTTNRSERDGRLADTVLECVDVAGKLDTLPGFTQSVEADASPSIWTEMLAPNMDKYLHYLLKWHSSALDLADWTWSGTGAAYPFVVLGSDGESLFDQADRRAQALVPDYYLTCNRRGQLQTVVDPMLQDAGSRTATVQAALTAADIREIQHTHQRPPRYHWLRSDAILAHATEISAVFCVAPGTAPGQGLAEQPHNQQLAASQAALNSCEGHRYARLNAHDSYFLITLAGSDDLDIEPADLTWVTVTLPAAYAAQRGLSFAAARGLVHEMTISYEPSRTGVVKTITLLWEREVAGSPATTYVPPVVEDPPGWIPPDPGPDPVPGPGTGFGTVYVMTETNLGRTRDFSAASPSWSDITPVGANGLYDFILDPWAPSTGGFLSSEDGVYRSQDLDQASPSWSLVLSKAAIEAATGASPYTNGLKIVGSINVQGAFWLSYHCGGSNFVGRTADGGNTWAHVDLNPPFGAASAGAFDVVPHLIGGQHRLFQVNGEGDRLYRSNDGGVTWSFSSVSGVGDIHNLFSLSCPYDGNEAGNIIYLGGFSGTYKTDDAGATWSHLSYDGVLKSTGIVRIGIQAHTLDSDIVVAWVADQLWISENAGLTWVQKTATGKPGLVRAAGGFPTNSSQLYGVGNAGTTVKIGVSTDGGDTFDDKTGDWAWLWPTDSSQAAIAVDWTE